MSERPILFSASMVNAILEGRKTQTRRVVKPSIADAINFVGGDASQDLIGFEYGTYQNDKGKEMPPEWLLYCSEEKQEGVIPIGQLYGAIGDRLWVRETWRGVVQINGPHDLYKTGVAQYVPDKEHCKRVEYRATQEPDGEPWRPSIHMPRWASRINLEITDIRVQRLQDISEEDALAEGVYAQKLAGTGLTGPISMFSAHKMPHPNCAENAVGGYRELWQSINGTNSWYQNPWVWVIEFKRVD